MNSLYSTITFSPSKTNTDQTFAKEWARRDTNRIGTACISPPGMARSRDQIFLPVTYHVDVEASADDPHRPGAILERLDPTKYQLGEGSPRLWAPCKDTVIGRTLAAREERS